LSEATISKGGLVWFVMLFAIVRYPKVAVVAKGKPSAASHEGKLSPEPEPALGMNAIRSACS
jgi:hypothetical protein